MKNKKTKEEYNALTSNIVLEVTRIKKNISASIELISSFIDINDLTANNDLEFTINSKNLITALSSFVHKVRFTFADESIQTRNYTVALGFPKNTSGYRWDKSIDDVNSSFLNSIIDVKEVSYENYMFRMKRENTYLALDDDSNLVSLADLMRDETDSNLSVSIIKINTDDDLVEPYEEKDYSYEAYNLYTEPNLTYIIVDDPNINIGYYGKLSNDTSHGMAVTIAALSDENNLIDSNDGYDIHMNPNSTYIYSRSGNTVNINRIAKPMTDKTTKMHIEVAKVKGLENLKK